MGCNHPTINAQPLNNSMITTKNQTIPIMKYIPVMPFEVL